MKTTFRKWWNPWHWCQWWWRRRFGRIVHTAVNNPGKAVTLDADDCASVEAWVQDYLKAHEKRKAALRTEQETDHE